MADNVITNPDIPVQRALLDFVQDSDYSVHSKIQEANQMCKILEQQSTIRKLREQLYQRLDNMEQFIRINMIRIFNVKENSEEDTFMIVINIFANLLNIPIKMSELESCTRIDSMYYRSPRPIVVRFSSLNTKNKVLQNKRLLIGTGIGMFDELSPQTRKIFNEAARYFGRRRVWTKLGIVMVLLSDNHQIRFRSLRQLHNYFYKIKNG